MSETLQIWLFGIFGAWLVGISLFIHRLAQNQTRFETVLVMVSKKAAGILHSPTNHHGLDELIERYNTRHYELTPDEWRELMEKTEAIESDSQFPVQERLCAAFISSVCRHKLRLPWEPLRRHQ